jgi:hypothetical protein
MIVGFVFHIQTSDAQKSDGGKQMVFMEQMLAIRTAQAATVVIMPPDSYFLVRLNETTLREYGCTFVTRDPSRIASLFDILKRADVTIYRGAEKMLEPRQGLFLILPNGSGIKFLFGRSFRDRSTVEGTFSHLPHLENIDVTGNQTLPRDLALWAAETGPPITKLSYMQSGCEWFIAMTKDSK